MNKLTDRLNALAERDAEIVRLNRAVKTAIDFADEFRIRAEAAEAVWNHLYVNAYHSLGMICIPAAEWKAATDLRAAILPPGAGE